MRHLKARRKLGLNPSHRTAMLRNMVTSLFLHGRIRTTEARAKELRRIAEKLLTLGKRVPPSTLAGLEGDALTAARARRVHAIRQARVWVNSREALSAVFGEYAERYISRPGGYTRILKLDWRPGDNAKMALIELVDHPRPAPAEGPAADETGADDASDAAPADE